MPTKSRSFLLLAFLAAAGAIRPVCAEVPSMGGAVAGVGVITNAADVRELSPEVAARRLPVRLRGVATYVFDRRSAFVQDETAGIYVGDGAESPEFSSGDVVIVEGETSPGQFAPLVKPITVSIAGRSNLPPPRRVTYEDLITGCEDSQWVSVRGLVRRVSSDSSEGVTLEISSGAGRIGVYVLGAAENGLANLVDAQVNITGVCGTWFNKQRQLFGIRLMVPRPGLVAVEEPAPTNAAAQVALPIGKLMRFTPSHSNAGRRTKVFGTVILYEPGSALYVQDGMHGLLVQTRQTGELQPGDSVELLGFPAKGEYTPMLEDAVWHRVGTNREPDPILVTPDQALGGLQDCRLVTIEGRLLEQAYNDNETVLLLEERDVIFSAHLESAQVHSPSPSLENGSRLRITGVCRIEVGSQWQAGPDWKAKSFKILMRSPDDVAVIKAPPWWTLKRLLWTVGLLLTAVVAALAWGTQLRAKVRKQTAIIRQQLDVEAKLKERYVDLFENANDMVYTHLLTGQITSINLAGERLLGRSRHDVVGKMLVELVAEEQRHSAAQWLDHIVDGTSPPTIEWDFVTAVGGLVRLEISTRLIERDGKQVEVEGIGRDVTERRRLEKEILEISAREQHRIGHDLHDGVCQQLAGIGLLTDTLADKLQEQHLPEAAEAQRISELVNQANQQTRGVARGLFPVRLEENGLTSALEELAENAGSFFQTRCVFRCNGPMTIRDHTVAHHVYFIVQEAIVNAVKHGKAKSVEVQLGRSGGQQFVAVRNDGLAFRTPYTGRGMGIRIMNYRAKMIGAELQIRPLSQSGTEVVCWFRGEPTSA